MAGHQEIFPTLHTVMVQAERASFLEEVLSSLSVSSSASTISARVLGALVYPTMLVVMGSLVMIGALIFFVPKFEPISTDKQAVHRGRLFHERNVVQPLADSHCRGGRGDRFLEVSRARLAKGSSVGDSRFPWRTR